MKQNRDKVVQKGNEAGGDIVGRDKVDVGKLVIKKELIVKQKKPIRSKLGFDTSIDQENTLLIQKLKDGNVNPFMRSKAIQKKLEALSIILDMCKTESGSQIVADIYESLVTMIENKYLIKMEEGDLLKFSMEEIHEDLKEIIVKYEEIVQLDEPILTGLLYIATSNCAIRWNVEEVS